MGKQCKREMARKEIESNNEFRTVLRRENGYFHYTWGK